MSALNIGDCVVVHSPGHQQDRQVGMVAYESKHWGTIGVDINGSTFGFFPSELAKEATP